MLPERTASEAVSTVANAVQGYIARGACMNCSITLVATDLQVPRADVENVWIDYNFPENQPTLFED